MAKASMSVREWLVQMLEQQDGDFLKEGVRRLVEGIMELEVSAAAGAGRYERSGERRDQRNGYRERQWDTRVGSIALRIPKLRHQGYQPSFLEPRTRSERALFAVVQEAYVFGVSTRKVEHVVQAMGVTQLDKSQVSRMCAELDEWVDAWRARPLDEACPYVWLDAKYLHVREGGRVVTRPVVVAYAVRQDGFRTVLGAEVFDLESGATWRSFLRSLLDRGLRGVELVISDAHAGLQEAIQEQLPGVAWQRCYVHFMRDLEGLVTKKDRDGLGAILRHIFRQETKAEAIERLRAAVDALRTKHPRVAQRLEDAESSVLAHMDFPAEHWKQIRSTNPLERLNKEIGRRADVIGIFPSPKSVRRLVVSLLMEQDDEWRVAHRYMSLHSMARLLAPQNEPQPRRLPDGKAA